jgi:hypothetical protein
MEINLYRILQESLNNIIKHASASEANVKITKNGKLIEITIQDNGKGFDTASTRLGESQNGSGFGLFGITERARILALFRSLNPPSGKEQNLFEGGNQFMSDKIRLVIADDHPFLRQGLRQTIEREANRTESGREIF